MREVERSTEGDKFHVAYDYLEILKNIFHVLK